MEMNTIMTCDTSTHTTHMSHRNAWQFTCINHVVKHLIILQANYTNEPMIFWRSSDTLLKGQTVPDNIIKLLHEAAAAQCGNINSLCYFFYGQEYCFVDSTASNVGHTTNSVCIGKRIVLDPREPTHDNKEPYRTLTYPPLAIWVKPMDIEVGAVCGDLGPEGCIPIRRCSTGIIQLKLPHKRGEPSRTLRFSREGIPLGDAYAVSDYFCEGTSFKDACWIADMTPPTDGPFMRASVFVILSRFKSLKNFRTLRRLWNIGDEQTKNKMVEMYHTAAQMGAPLREELDRIDTLADITLQLHKDMFSELKIASTAK